MLTFNVSMNSANFFIGLSVYSQQLIYKVYICMQIFTWSNYSLCEDTCTMYIMTVVTIYIAMIIVLPVSVLVKELHKTNYN